MMNHQVSQRELAHRPNQSFVGGARSPSMLMPSSSMKKTENFGKMPNASVYPSQKKLTNQGQKSFMQTKQPFVLQKSTMALPKKEEWHPKMGSTPMQQMTSRRGSMVLNPDALPSQQGGIQGTPSKSRFPVEPPNILPKIKQEPLMKSMYRGTSPSHHLMTGREKQGQPTIPGPTTFDRAPSVSRLPSMTERRHSVQVVPQQATNASPGLSYRPLPPSSKENVPSRSIMIGKPIEQVRPVMAPPLGRSFLQKNTESPQLPLSSMYNMSAGLPPKSSTVNSHDNSLQKLGPGLSRYSVATPSAVNKSASSHLYPQQNFLNIRPGLPNQSIHPNNVSGAQFRPMLQGKNPMLQRYSVASPYDLSNTLPPNVNPGMRPLPGQSMFPQEVPKQLTTSQPHPKFSKYPSTMPYQPSQPFQPAEQNFLQRRMSFESNGPPKYLPSTGLPIQSSLSNNVSINPKDPRILMGQRKSFEVSQSALPADLHSSKKIPPLPMERPSLQGTQHTILQKQSSMHPLPKYLPSSNDASGHRSESQQSHATLSPTSGEHLRTTSSYANDTSSLMLSRPIDVESSTIISKKSLTGQTTSPKGVNTPLSPSQRRGTQEFHTKSFPSEPSNQLDRKISAKSNASLASATQHTTLRRETSKHHSGNSTPHPDNSQQDQNSTSQVLRHHSKTHSSDVHHQVSSVPSSGHSQMLGFSHQKQKSSHSKSGSELKQKESFSKQSRHRSVSIHDHRDSVLSPTTSLSPKKSFSQNPRLSHDSRSLGFRGRSLSDTQDSSILYRDQSLDSFDIRDTPRENDSDAISSKISCQQFYPNKETDTSQGKRRISRGIQTRPLTLLDLEQLALLQSSQHPSLSSSHGNFHYMNPTLIKNMFPWPNKSKYQYGMGYGRSSLTSRIPKNSKMFAIQATSTRSPFSFGRRQFYHLCRKVGTQRIPPYAIPSRRFCWTSYKSL